MMRVPVRTEATFVAGAPEVLFEGRYLFHRARNYDISPDGARFLMVKNAVEDEGLNRQHLVLVQNFAEELKRLVPTDN